MVFLLRTEGPFGQKGRKHIHSSVRAAEILLTDLELHGILWNAKPVTIRPPVFLLSVAVDIFHACLSLSLSCGCLAGELCSGCHNCGVQSALLSWRPLLASLCPGTSLSPLLTVPFPCFSHTWHRHGHSREPWTSQVSPGPIAN